MAVTVQAPMVIPGLHAPPTIEDLKQSSVAYNLLRDDGDQPAVQKLHLQELASLFTYNLNQFMSRGILGSQ